MPSLQRSCQACINSKRRCDLTSPCSRCAKKSICCRYINAPSEAQPRDSTPIDRPDRAFLPEVRRTYKFDTLQRLKDLLLSFTAEFIATKSTSFIHPGLHGRELPRPLTRAWDIASTSAGRIRSSKILQRTVADLIRRGNQQTSYIVLLAHAQAALLLSIMSLLESPSQPPIDATALWNLTHRLWEEAPGNMGKTDDDFSLWREWLLSESVRRTILACNVLLRTWMTMKQGYAMQSLCIEALPFDERLELWNADCEDEWERLVARSSGAKLVSVTEYVTMRGDKGVPSAFAELVLLAFKQADEPALSNKR